jgi:hypothetical protein
MKKSVTATDLELFRCLLQDMIKTYYAKHYALNNDVPLIEITPAKKYARIVRAQGGQSSSYGFVDMTTGDLLKAASWTQPAKHARGNIFAENPLAGCGPYGMAYLK